MKNFIVKSTLTLVLATCFLVSHAQMETGQLVGGYFKDGTAYVAQITAVTSTGFTCKFVHSASVYIFNNLKKDISDPVRWKYYASVVSQKGGKYLKGDVFSFRVYRRGEKVADLSKPIAPDTKVYVSFSDGKVFLGNAQDAVNGFVSVRMIHSGNSYVINPKGVITLKTGGYYKVGEKATVYKADEVMLDL